MNMGNVKAHITRKYTELKTLHLLFNHLFVKIRNTKKNPVKDVPFTNKVPSLEKWCLFSVCTAYTTSDLHLQVSCCHIFRMNKTNTNKKGNLVKSDGMKRHLFQFCTLKQNQLPLACLGVEGKGSTQKQRNYSALAQQQRAKRASKAFLWAERGSLRAQPVCEYHLMDVRSSLGTQEAKDVSQCQY